MSALERIDDTEDDGLRPSNPERRMEDMERAGGPPPDDLVGSSG